MLVEIIAFILGFITSVIVLSLCRACNDTIEKICLLKDLWYQYENGEDVKDKLRMIIYNL